MIFFLRPGKVLSSAILIAIWFRAKIIQYKNYKSWNQQQGKDEQENLLDLNADIYYTIHIFLSRAV